MFATLPIIRGHPVLKTIVTCADYQMVLHRQTETSSNTLLITFGGQPVGLGESGFGTNFALSQGWDTVYVSQKEGAQYQGLSIDQFVSAIAPVAQHWDNVVCYGSSLGAYAALYYGGAIDARILAAAPMLPAWPAFGSKSYDDLTLTHIPLVQTPKATRPPVVIYDPMKRKDRMIVEDMVSPAYPDHRAIEVPFGGHTVLVTLSKANLLTPLITGLVNDDVILDFTPPGEGTAVFHGERGTHLMETDLAAARVELERSLALSPDRRIFNQLFECLLTMGDLPAAQALLDHGRAAGGREHTLFGPKRKKAEKAGLTV